MTFSCLFSHAALLDFEFITILSSRVDSVSLISSESSFALWRWSGFPLVVFLSPLPVLAFQSDNALWVNHEYDEKTCEQLLHEITLLWTLRCEGLGGALLRVSQP